MRSDVTDTGGESLLGLVDLPHSVQRGEEGGSKPHLQHGDSPADGASPRRTVSGGGEQVAAGDKDGLLGFWSLPHHIDEAATSELEDGKRDISELGSTWQFRLSKEWNQEADVT